MLLGVFVGCFRSKPVFDVAPQPKQDIRCPAVELRESSVTDLVFRRRWEDALGALERSPLDDPHDNAFVKGFLHLRLGNYAAAESLLSSLIGTGYELVDWAEVFCAQAAFNLGDYDRAFALARRAGKLPGLEDDIAEVRFRALWRAGKKQEAIAQLDTLYRQGFLGRRWYRLWKASCLRDAGKPAEAKRLFALILDETPARPSYRSFIRRVAREYAKTPDLSPDDEMRIALAFYKARSYGDAVKYFRKVLASEKSSRAEYYLACSYAGLGSYEKALGIFDGLLASGRYDRGSLWWRVGRCMRKQGRFGEAHEALDSALAACGGRCGNRINIIKERIFLAFDEADWRALGCEGRRLVRVARGTNDGAIGLVWSMIGYILSGVPDSAVAVAREARRWFGSKDFLDEVRYWEARALLAYGDTAQAESILAYVANSRRVNLFAWLSRAYFGEELPSPEEFRSISFDGEDSVFSSAARFLSEFLGRRWIAALPSEPLAHRAEKLAALGMKDLARHCFESLEREGVIGSNLAEKLTLWRYFLSLGLTKLAYREGAEICRTLGEPPPEMLKLVFIMPFRADVLAHSEASGISPCLVYAVMMRESQFDPYAGSYAGALGLMQFIPSTASAVAKEMGLAGFKKDLLYDYRTNIALGAAFLGELLGRRGSPYYALAEYNAGPRNLSRWVELCPVEDQVLCAELFDIRQTRLYVKAVMGYFYTYHWLYAKGGRWRRW